MSYITLQFSVPLDLNIGFASCITSHLVQLSSAMRHYLAIKILLLFNVTLWLMSYQPSTTFLMHKSRLLFRCTRLSKLVIVIYFWFQCASCFLILIFGVKHQSLSIKLELDISQLWFWMIHPRIFNFLIALSDLEFSFLILHQLKINNNRQLLYFTLSNLVVRGLTTFG